MSAEVTVLGQEIRDLIRQPESTTLEFKTSVPDAAMISQVLASFANTDGGVLIVGVREGGEVIGTDVLRLARAVEQVRQQLNPPQDIRLDTPTIDGRQIGVVRIGKSAMATVFADAGVFVRRGSQSRPMAAEDLARRLQRAPEQIDETAIAAALAKQTVMIEALRVDLRNANCWRSKAKDYVIGGVIGAFLGALASLVIK